MNNYFSIIVPFYNREEFLKNTLLSIYQQSYRPIQLILVDNNSCDGSNKIAIDFKKEYYQENFQVVLTHEKKQTAGAARNKGIALSIAEYLVFFDSDDLMSPDYISSLSKEFSKDPNLNIVLSRTAMKKGAKRIKRKVFYTDSLTDHILTGMISTQSFGIQKSFLEKIGCWDDHLKVWNDWELGARILLNTPKLLWITSKTFHEINLHPKSLTGDNFYISFKERLEALRTVEKELEFAYNDQEKNRAEIALVVKKIILAANISKENHPEGKQLFLEIFNSSSFFRKPFYYFLYLFTKFSIPGSWYIARCLIKINMLR